MNLKNSSYIFCIKEEVIGNGYKMQGKSEKAYNTSLYSEVNFL